MLLFVNDDHAAGRVGKDKFWPALAVATAVIAIAGFLGWSAAEG